LRHRQDLQAEVVTQKVEAVLDPADEGLVGVLFLFAVLPLRVRFGLCHHRTGTSVPGGRTDLNGTKADLAA
ncbi:MAG: hypothetical protein V3U73_13950, partial [bacterium]